MGQEQSFVTHGGVSPVRRYKDKYEDPIDYRTSVNYRSNSYEEKDYKRHKSRRSADSFKSDNSSTESSGYRSGSSAYECRSDYYCSSIYKNDHYKDVNKELYKPVKIPKEKRYKVQLFDGDRDEIKSARLQSYLSDTEKAKLKAGPTKKAGIRNYTPKIISEEEQRKKLDNWI